nr:uncharacterized protein LOC128694391 [Cherax quadricarinatus]
MLQKARAGGREGVAGGRVGRRVGARPLLKVIKKKTIKNQLVELLVRRVASMAAIHILVYLVVVMLVVGQSTATLQDNMVILDHPKMPTLGEAAERVDWLEAASEGTSQVAKSRGRRYLYFPTGSYVTFDFNMTMPMLGIGDYGSWQTVAAVTFYLPNSTFNWGRSHQQGASDRTSLYRRFETFLSGLGYDGHACTLRTLCEIAESPFEHSFYGEVVNLILSASKSPDEESVYEEYMRAEYYGKTHGDCDRLYSDCPHSVLDKVSQAFTF